MKTQKTNKMNTVVSINWKIKDLIRDKVSFDDWYLGIFGVRASRKVLSQIKAKADELVEMKKAVFLAATDEAAA
jgi:hypothetical protein